MSRGRPRHPDEMTPREWQVLDLLGEGLTNAEIAVRLEVSPETVKTHVADILSKLDVRSRQEAVAWAVGRKRLGVVGMLGTLLRTKPIGLGLKLGAVVAVALISLGSLALLANSGEETAPGMGKLAYILDGNLWVKDMPDGQPSQLTFDGDSWSPAWSPSGEWLSDGFTTDTQPSGLAGYAVDVMRSDGSQVRYAEGCYAWSPVEDLLLCTRNNMFWTERPDGTRQQGFDLVRVVKQIAGRDIWGGLCHAWNPDGDRVACHVFGNAVAGDGGPTQYSALWVVDLVGQNARELYGTDIQSGSGGWIIVGGWLDANNVTFTQTNPATQRCWLYDCSAPGVSIYQVSDQGGPPILVGVTSVSEAWWSSESTSWLLTEGPGPHMWTNKRVIKIDGQGRVTALTDAGNAATSATWSPDGTEVLYVSAPDAGELVAAASSDAGQSHAGVQQAKARRRIWLMNADGSGKRLLTDDDRYRDERPQWSKDGKHVVFMRFDAEGYASVWTMSLDDGNAYKVADVSSGLSSDLWIEALRSELGREASFYRWFDYFGQVSQWLLYSWWQPQ